MAGKGGKLSYAGSEACRECHRAIYDSWRQTGMSAMLRPFGEGAGLADFSQPSEFTDTDGKAVVRMGGGSRPYFEFAADGGWKATAWRTPSDRSGSRRMRRARRTVASTCFRSSTARCGAPG